MTVEQEAVYEKNVSLLEKHHPSAWYVFTMDKEAPSDRIELVSTDTGRPNLLVKGVQNETILIHDRENPGAESGAFLSKIETDATSVVLVFGMGLGYLPLELLKQKKKLQRILIFELNIELFRLTLRHMDLTYLLGDKRVTLSIGNVENVEELLKPVKRSLMLENIHTHKLLTCFQFNPGYEDLSSAVFDIVSEYNIEGSTQSVGGQIFVENRLKHLTSMHHDQMLEDLAGKFNGVPALMVSAGPSLDKNLHEVKQAVGRSVVIAVDTALPALLDKDIIPDFVTSIDFNAPIYEKIADLATDPRARKINLICSSWVATTVTKRFPARSIFWAFAENNLEKWMNNALGGKLAIEGAGTVAHLNFLAAKVLGCDPLIFVGQDLAYSYKKEHASNVVFTGTEPMSKILENAVWAKGVNEPEVPTTRGMHGYRLIFEKWIANMDGRAVNATEGGAFIEGAEHMPLSDAIALFCQENVIIDIPGDDPRRSPSNAMIFKLKEVNQAEKIIKKAARQADVVLKGVSKLKNKKKKITCLEELPSKLCKQIITLDSIYHKSDRLTLWQLFDEMTMEGLRQDEREKNEIEQLQALPEKYLEWLVKSVKRTDRVNGIRLDNLSFFKRQLKTLISYYADEKKILGRIEKGETANKDVQTLAEMYFQNGDYNLLDSFLTTYGTTDTPDNCFYSGVIGLHRRAYEKTETYFEKAVALDGKYKSIIAVKRRAMADFYYEWAGTVPFDSLASLESKSGLYLRIKGLKCFPDHEPLLADFRKLAEKEMKEILDKARTAGGGLQSSEPILESWVELLVAEEHVRKSIPEDYQVAFYRHYGKTLLDKGEFETARTLYTNVVAFLPGQSQLHVSLADLCFSTGDFNSGFESLKKAVFLDPKLAVYWRNIGDNLQTRGDFKRAVIAYENFFSILPSEIATLKKLSDCYLKIGNLEQAEKCQKRFETLNSGR